MAACSVGGCNRPLYVKKSGFCSLHYNRLRDRGSLDDPPKTHAPYEERLWRSIDRRGPAECWPWRWGLSSTGYGTIRTDDRRMVLAHRAVWEQVNGPLPRRSGHHGSVVMHTCDNRACCNPEHLRVGSQKDNVDDMDAKARRRQVNLRGEAHGMSKWTVEQVRAVKRATGTQREIAQQTGVALGSVKAIRRGVVWRHIT